MSLAGQIEAFPIPEILRLLARSQKSGCLRIETSGAQGKLYLDGGVITYGTTRQDESLGEDMIAAGLVEEQAWLEVERRERAIVEVLADSRSEEDLGRFMTELVIDVVFRLQRLGDGEFEFEDGVAPRYETGQLVDVEAVLAETEVRVNQWQDIEEVIPGVSFRLRMAPELTGNRDVTLTDEAWRLLAALEGFASIADVAERTGTTDFQVGKVLADLVREGLVEVVDDVGGGQYFYGEGESSAEDDKEAEDDTTAEDDPGDGAELLESVITDVAEEAQKPLFSRKRGVGSMNRDRSE